GLRRRVVSLLAIGVGIPLVAWSFGKLLYPWDTPPAVICFAIGVLPASALLLEVWDDIRADQARAEQVRRRGRALAPRTPARRNVPLLPRRARRRARDVAVREVRHQA